jgi:hypothetical protein
MARQSKTRQGMARRDKATREQGKARQGNARQTRQGKARQDNTRHKNKTPRQDTTTHQGRQDKTQYQHLLNVNCGGNARAQHIWQTVRPDLAHLAVEDVDSLTKEAIGHMLSKNALPNEQVENQYFRPLRHAGLGYRKAKNTLETA